MPKIRSRWEAGWRLWNHCFLRKTVYDPKIISQAEYIKRGFEAANNSLKTNGVLGRQWEGYDSHGVRWFGFGRDGQPISFFPDIPK